MIRICHLETTILTNSHSSLKRIYHRQILKNKTAQLDIRRKQQISEKSDQTRSNPPDGWVYIIQRSLDFMLNTGRGQQGIYQNVLSAHQPQSAADPESPLRPRHWSTHLVWWRPQPPSRSLWSLAIEIQEERRGKRGRMTRRWGGGVESNTATWLSFEFPPLRCWNML